MRVAVCLYGYPRHFQNGIKSLEHFFEDIEHDYFIHAWHDPNNSSDIEFNRTHDDISKTFKPVSFVLENQLEFKKSFDFPHDISCLKPELISQGIGVSTFLSALYSIKRVGELLQESPNNYDLVVLTRMDVFSYKQLKSYHFESYDEIYSSFCHGQIWDLNNLGDCIDTKMIISNKSNMIFFMKLYEFVENYIQNDKIKVCHHRMFAHHLKKLDRRFHMMFHEMFNWYYIRSNGLLHGELRDSHIEEYKEIFQ